MVTIHQTGVVRTGLYFELNNTDSHVSWFFITMERMRRRGFVIYWLLCDGLQKLMSHEWLKGKLFNNCICIAHSFHALHTESCHCDHLKRCQIVPRLYFYCTASNSVSIITGDCPTDAVFQTYETADQHKVLQNAANYSYCFEYSELCNVSW
jgi:hypothetical protein